MAIRKTKYDVSLKLMTRLASVGLTSEEIAFVLGVPVPSFKQLLANRPKWQEALRKGNKKYNFDEVTMENGKPVKIVRKHYPGDVTAQKHWLHNRSEEWCKPKNVAMDISFKDLMSIANGKEEKGDVGDTGE